MSRLTLTPRQYRQVAELALLFLTLIVFTGAAVRLSGSGLGCPDWPKCYGKVAPPLETHAWIEFGNRMLSGLVGVVAATAGLLAFRRRPYRRDLAVIGVLLPLGVVGQAVLGGFTVRNHLAPGFVMGHYALSMLILIAAAALAWRARWEPGERPRSTDRLSVWAAGGPRPRGAGR
jgi:cytochrome c oxidase assembly protein subunit 15